MISTILFFWGLIWETILIVLLLWTGYIATMDLKENFKQLRLEVKVVALIPAVLSWGLDVLLNVVLLSILSWEVPKEITITKRLKRWKQMPTIAPKKAAFARYICESWLNPFDKGHC